MENYLEYQKQKESNEIKGETFALKKFEKENNLKFLISELNPKEELTKLILDGKADITAAITFGNYLIVGDIMGSIFIYSLKELKLINILTCALEKQINALDIDDDGDYIFAGFSNGNIAVYDLVNNKRKLINIPEYIKSLINMKIVDRIDAKTFRIISSDEEGNVFSIIIKWYNSLFSTTNVETIYKIEKYPTSLIYPFKVKENEIKDNNFIKNLNKYVALGNSQNVTIYSLGPQINKIFTFEKPDYAKNECIPDVGIGLNNESSEQEDDKLCLLFAVSWDKVIKLFIIPLIDDKTGNPNLIGHYINDIEIIKIGVLNAGTIFLVDKSGNFKLLNTKKFISGEPQIDEDFSTPIISLDNNKCELQKAMKFDGAISNKKILNLNKDELIILTNKKIYNQKLFNYQYYFKKYIKTEEKWMELLVLGINIYQGNILAFSGIPLIISERKKVIGKFLEEFISQYLFVNIKKRHTFQNDKIEKMMEIIIEFCIEIESVNYLLSYILKAFEARNYKNLFLKKLEPFILCDKLLKYEIQDEVILSIMSIYESNKDLNTLEKLLFHINLKSLDASSVKEEIISLNLLSALLYMYLNGSELDYKTIKKIYNNIEQNSQYIYKEFKPFILELFYNLKKEKNICNRAEKLFSDCCFNSSKIFQKMKYKGDAIILDECDVCKKSLKQSLSNKEKINIFKCKHKVHKSCSLKDKENSRKDICPICLKVEIEDCVTSGSNNPKFKMSYYESLKENNNNENEQKNKEDNIKKGFNPKKAFNRMRAYDNLRRKKRNSFYNDII